MPEKKVVWTLLALNRHYSTETNRKLHNEGVRNFMLPPRLSILLK